MKMTIKGPSAKDDKRWRAEMDAETLVRAKEIQADKARYAAAMKVCRDKCEALERVTGDDD